MKLIKIIKRGGCHINRSKIRSQGNHTILIVSISLCVYLVHTFSVSISLFLCLSRVFTFSGVTIVSLLSLVLKFSVYVPVFSPFLCLCVCVSVVVFVSLCCVSLCLCVVCLLFQVNERISQGNHSILIVSCS